MEAYYTAHVLQRGAYYYALAVSSGFSGQFL